VPSIDDYWAFFFGINGDAFEQPEPQVVAHAALQGYSGAWIFRRNSSVIITVPPGWVKPIRTALEHTSHPINDEEFIALFGDAVGAVVGPAYQGFLDPTHSTPVTSTARQLTPQDNSALQELAARCDEQEWEHSSIDAAIQSDTRPHFGCFVDARLVAVANYSKSPPSAAMPGIITHPAHRKRGYGRAVLSAATQHGLDNGLLMLYQTLLANKPAIAAAEGLGYQPYATHLALRLR
jgi:RimJ/RimL family protein N-acetyltransferase